MEKLKKLEKLKELLPKAGKWLGNSWSRSWVILRNKLRQVFKAKVDYLVIELKGDIPELPPDLPFWRRMLLQFQSGKAQQISLLELRDIFDQVIEDPNVRGIILRISSLDVGWARAQSLRQELKRLQERGKTITAFLNECSMSSYFVASVADHVYAPPSANWLLLGLRSEVMFLKDALAHIGVEAEVLAVSPYKTAGDALSRSEMSGEQREMLEWLIGDLYDAFLEDVAASRGKTSKQISKLIDKGLMSMEEVQAAGLVDELCYEDELAGKLSENSGESDTPLVLLPLETGLRKVRERYRKQSGKFIGLVSVTGAITMGRSRKLPGPVPMPFGQDERAGCDSVVADLRAGIDNDKVAAILLYVNSPGGDAAASDYIWREVKRAAEKKPVVVCMGDVAASGGYYVSCCAQKIVAGLTTLTGSIGVITMKLATDGLWNKLKLHHEAIERGKHAGLFGDSTPLSPAQKKQMFAHVNHAYDRFLDVVGDGRGMERDALEHVAGGRVWTGRLARENGLVDELGDIRTAYELAKELAESDSDSDLWTPLIYLKGEAGSVPGSPEPAEEPAQVLWSTLLEPVRFWQSLQLKPLTLAPFSIKNSR